MRNSFNYLPEPLSDDSIHGLLDDLGLPRPFNTLRPSVIAAFHSIYILSYDPEVLSEILKPLPHIPFRHETDLILRVSGTHLPAMKTLNECAIMRYLSQNTTIPIPGVIRFSADVQNPLGYEYQLLTRSSGMTSDQLYSTFSKTQTESFFDQIIDILSQLHRLPFSHIGGLTFMDPSIASTRPNDVSIIPGPVCEETFWFDPDIEKYWNVPHDLHETSDTLNIKGPFSTYVAYISAHIRTYIYAISKHPELEFIRYLIPRLKQFLAVIQDKQEEWDLNQTRLVLAHKDMHLANIIYLPTTGPHDISTGTVTGLIDWEFACVVPFPRWDPHLAFLRNMNINDLAKSKKIETRRNEGFHTRCEERGVDVKSLIGTKTYANEKQEAMQTVQRFLRAICEVCPRGQQKDLVGSWKQKVEATLVEFE
ncbi:hypothetical protein MMC14_002323 [Varicellaria rhodocarpa]|nr:hypothetical protein [Varicellaria rhodocarpa]